jgi:hypothetical protein
MTKRDLWRNVRIPFLHMLSGYDKTRSDWTTVPKDMISDYSSLIGIPIRGFPATWEGNTTFTIQTNYQTLEVRRSTACGIEQSQLILFSAGLGLTRRNGFMITMTPFCQWLWMVCKQRAWECQISCLPSRWNKKGGQNPGH